MRVDVTFPKGVRVDAHVGGFTLTTDQPIESGGGDEGPSPYALFLSSIATCAGFFAVKFCRERDIDTDGMVLSALYDRDMETKTLKTVTIELKLPEGFPAKYQKAIIRTMDQCSVKKALMAPPEFVIKTL
jgi:uncharacterized OsmC-like protein